LRDRKTGADDTDAAWPRQLLVALGALLAVALIVGGIASMVALGAAGVVGLGGGDDGPRAQPSLYVPPLSPVRGPGDLTSSGTTDKATADPDAGATEGPDSSGGEKSAQDKKSGHEKHAKKRGPRITLHASPTRVAPGERIDLTGRYRHGNGATLQVQRRQGGNWGEFPVTTTVSGGRFHTWVLTSQAGANHFRVLDQATGRHSAPVTVHIRG
jgi:hypothetical protein